MSYSVAQRPPQLPNVSSPSPLNESKRWRLTWRRILIALIVVFLLHIVFFVAIAPYIGFESKTPARTEVVQISQQELNRLKDKILKERPLNPLLKQELREEFKTKEPPKDAQMIAPFNQTVPKQQVAGPQPDAPQEGGGGAKQSAKPRQQQQTQPRERLNLSKLGLGNRVVPSPRRPPETLEDQIRERSQAQGPPGPFRPRGLDLDNVDRGNQNLLNAVESEYYSFFARFTEPLARNWYYLMRTNMPKMHQELAQIHARKDTTYHATIEFILDRQGNFHTIRVIEQSGLPTLDSVSAEAFRKLGSLPNPPAGLFEGGQYFTYHVRFSLHNNMDSEDLPNISWY